MSQLNKRNKNWKPTAVPIAGYENVVIVEIESGCRGFESCLR